MAGGPKSKFRIPRLEGLAVWGSITGLLALGLITTLIDLAALPLAEAARANEARQRFVVNAVSGEVSLGDTNPEASAKPASAFDVGTAEEAANEPAEPQAPAPAQDEQPVPADTPVAEAITVEPVATEPAPEQPVAAEPAAAEPAGEPAVAQPVAAAPEEASPLAAYAPSLRTTPLPTSSIAMPALGKKSLVGAPAPEVTETVDGLALPKRGANEVTPAKLYAQRFTRTPEQVLLSFVIIHAGIDPQSAGLMLALPPQVTVAYSPYARAETSFSAHMRAAGHEVWTMLPTMSDRYPSDDPGPMGIIGRMPPEEVARRTRQAMAAIAGSVGFVLPPDEAVSVLKGSLSPALDEISNRGLLLLSTHPSRSIDQITTAKEMQEIIRRADMMLDASPNEPLIRSKLAGILEAAKGKAHYVVLLSARPQSVQLLAQWLKETKLEEPFVLAPLSAIYLPSVAPVAAAPEGDGHGEKKKEEKPKPEAKKKQKVLPQDQYKQPAEGAKKDAGHGGGGH